MRIPVKFLISALLYGACLGVCAAQDYKIGTLDVVRIIKQSPQTKAANERIDKEFSVRETKLTAAGEELKKLEDRMAKDQAILSEEEFNRLERDIVTRKREMKRDQDEFREDLNFRRNEEFTKMRKVIIEAIQKVAAESKYDLVLGEGIVYSSPELDMSDMVIEFLKREYGDKAE